MGNIKLGFVKRAFKAVNLKRFKKSHTADKVAKYILNCPYEDQHILRMMIRKPHGEFVIPKELEWVKDLVELCNNIQEQNNIRHPFCYITVRHGIHKCTTEDEWHTDGYSEVITHLPEQNYIVTNGEHTTEILPIHIKFPKKFNALKHDVVKYINSVISKIPKVLVNEVITKALPNTVYVFDPYVIHRRPPEAFGTQRTFVRVTFVPIEIYDDACTPNPLMERVTYNRNASCTRDKLEEYKGQK